MIEKISEKFHDYVFNQSEVSGVEDQISEINDIVSRKNIALSVSLESGAGEKYFYESMKLAENVIKSFETEQQKSKLNDNQEIALWLMQNRFKRCARDIESGLLEYLTMVSDEAYLSNKEFAQVLQVFANWALDQC